MRTEKIKGHWVRCYDNGGRTFDRFTVVFLPGPVSGQKLYPCLGMSLDPYHPQGFGQHSEGVCGRHLGRRVRLCALPKPCQRAVDRDLESRPETKTPKQKRYRLAARIDIWADSPEEAAREAARLLRKTPSIAFQVRGKVVESNPEEVE